MSIGTASLVQDYVGQDIKSHYVMLQGGTKNLCLKYEALLFFLTVMSDNPMEMQGHKTTLFPCFTHCFLQPGEKESTGHLCIQCACHWRTPGESHSWDTLQCVLQENELTVKSIQEPLQRVLCAKVCIHEFNLSFNFPKMLTNKVLIATNPFSRNLSFRVFSDLFKATWFLNNEVEPGLVV